MDHIHLVRWADVIVLCPATANTINRLGAGVADDLVGTMFLAHDFTKPYVVVPAMNAAMYAHPRPRRRSIVSVAGVSRSSSPTPARWRAARSGPDGSPNPT